MNLETLYSLAATGKEKIWSIEASDARIRVTFGYTGGRLQTQTRAAVSQEQAEKQALSRWKRKQKQGYAPRGASAAPEPRSWAMLAVDYTKRARDLVFPCWMQPKLDGTRAMFKDGAFFSRSGDPRRFGGDLERETAALVGAFPFPLDGEIYSDQIPFEQLAGLTNRAALDADEARVLSFHVFDHLGPGSFDARRADLESLFARAAPSSRVVFVETRRCESDAHAREWLDECRARGFEGIMLRNAAGEYRSGFRSKDLQKYKLFQDREYRVVGFKRGERGVLWQCATPEGRVFSVKPACADEESARMFAEGERYVGRLLTVKFQETTRHGVPRFPVAMRFKEN